MLNMCNPNNLSLRDKIEWIIKELKKLKKRGTSGGGGGVSDFISLSDTPNDYTGQAGKVVAVNSIENGLEFIDDGIPPIPWLSMLNGSNLTTYPQMLEGEMMVIKIVDLNGDEVEGGTAVIGGWNGTTVGNNSLLICMEDSTGGDVTVGYKYAIIGNYTGNQTIIQVADYTELTNGNHEDSSVLYVTVDDGKIWKWNASTSQHDEVSSVVAGTLVSASVFKDLNNVIVIPDNSHLYFDTTNETYYRWNGVMYEDIINTPSEKISFFKDISDNPPNGNNGNKPKKKIWANILTGSIWTWNGAWVKNGVVDWTTPIDKTFGIWDTATGKIINSKMEEHVRGVTVDGQLEANASIGVVITASVNGSYIIDCEALREHYLLTLTDDSAITFTNMITANQTAVITITLTGTYTFTFPSWLKPLPYNDAYDGSINNEIVINIKRGGSSPLGYYSLTNLPI